MDKKSASTNDEETDEESKVLERCQELLDLQSEADKKVGSVPR